MALNFGLLDTSLPEKIAGSYYAGQQQRQQNELAAQQAAMRQQELGMRQQEFGMRQQEAAQLAQERQAKLQRSAENQKLLTNLSGLMEQNGDKLNRPTLSAMLRTGMQTNQSELVQIATKGLQALDDKEQFEAEMGKIRPTPAAPAATNALAPAAQPATAAPTNALAGGYSRPQIESMLTSPNARMREMGGKLLGALPKEVPDTLSQRYVPVGSNVFDRVEQKWIQAPEKAPAPTKNIGNINPNDFTPSSIQKFIDSGKYSDLVPVAAKGGGGGVSGGAGATATGKPMTELQVAARRDKLGKEFKSVQNALQTTQDVLDSISFVKAEPGLSRATGFTGTLLPSFPEGAAAAAETRLKNLEGKVTALGKAQAAASGAIGSIANQEWKILADQIAAIDRSKGTGPLLGQLELIEAQATGAMERIKDAYKRQFGEDFEKFPQFADLPQPKSTFKPKAPAGGATGGWSVVR